MNEWTERSVNFANQRNYLDELYKVYPIVPNERRDLSKSTITSLQKAFDRDNDELVKKLLTLDVFPLKDSYVAYMKRDGEAIGRNPETVNRIAGTLHQMGFEDMIDRCSQPKETNRQIGPMFKTWIDKNVIGASIYRTGKEFIESSGNAIYSNSDAEMKKFCAEYFGYNREKGIDFIARFNDIYVVGESKFLTDFGGHQNAQFADALSTIKSEFISVDGKKVIPIAILDGILYIKGKNKMHKYLIDHPEEIIISSLILREFLYSL